jgi:hypothetical protein
MASSSPSSVSPIVNDPAGMSAMPSDVVMGVLVFCNKRKKFAGWVLGTLKAVTGTALLTVIKTALLAVTQFDEARLVVLCNT